MSKKWLASSVVPCKPTIDSTMYAENRSCFPQLQALTKLMVVLKGYVLFKYL